MRFSFEDNMTKILRAEDVIVYAQIDTLKLNNKLLVTEDTCKNAFNNEFRLFGNSLKRIAEKNLIKYARYDQNNKKGYLIEFIQVDADKAIEQISQKVEEEQQKQKIRDKKKKEKNKSKEEELDKYFPMVEEVMDIYNKKFNKNLKANKYSKRTQMIIDRFKGIRSVKATVEDFETVMDNMYYWWLELPKATDGDMKFAKYLVPETLFSAKHFDTYLEKTKGTIINEDELIEQARQKENDKLKQEKLNQGAKSNAFGW